MPVRDVLRRSLLSGLISAVVAAAPLAAQGVDSEPGIRITAISSDSVHLHLADSGYVLVVEYPARGRVRILHPHPGKEWTPRAPGAVTLSAAVEVVPEGGEGGAPGPQCLVRPTQLSIWSPEEGEQARPLRAACGPVPAPRASTPGISARRMVSFTYEPPSAFESYVVAFVVSAEDVPQKVLAGDRTMGPVVDWVRRTGEWMVRGNRGDDRWQAALWQTR